jgi:MFS family permease
MTTAKAFIQKHLRFNFVVGLLDGGFFGLGMGFSSFAAVIPLFVHHLTDSALIIGLVPAIHNLGWQLPQLFTADWVSRAKRYKPLALWMTIHERVPFLGLAVIAFFILQIQNNIALILIFVMLTWQGFGAGLAANPWTNMISKVIPDELHGTFFGSQAAAFNGTAGLSAIAAGLILEKVAGPVNFSLLFALTFFSMVASYIFLAMTREPDSEPNENNQPSFVWKKSLEILQNDRNFRAFILVRIISQFAGMGFAFYTIYAVKHFGMSEAAAAALVSVLLIGQIILSPLMGSWGDKWSHRGVMIIGAIGAALSAFLAWRAPSSNWFYAIFILEAAAIVAIWTIPLAFSVSFAKKEEDRPLYIGMANTIPAPATILAPVLGGWLADAAGFNVTFIVSALCGLVMALALWILVKDSQKTPPML